jgi:hypothetical protein
MELNLFKLGALANDSLSSQPDLSSNGFDSTYYLQRSFDDAGGGGIVLQPISLAPAEDPGPIGPYYLPMDRLPLAPDPPATAPDIVPDVQAPLPPTEIYLYLHFKDKQTGEDLAIDGKLIDNASGTILSQIASSYEAEISVQDVPATQLKVQLYKKGFKSITANVSDLLLLPDPKTIYFERGHNFPVLESAALFALIVFATRKKKKVGAITTSDIYPFLLIGGGLLAFSLIKKILESLGIWENKDSKSLDEAATDPNSWWNPTYWQSVKPANRQWSYAINYDTAAAWVTELQDAFTFYNDCEECAIAIFKRMHTKANASYFSWVFNQITGEDLLTYLRGGMWPQDRLSDADVNTINNYINNLAQY